VESLLGIPAEFELTVFLALGYSTDEGRRAKKPLAEVLRWNGF
jgi:hypothetical protein